MNYWEENAKTIQCVFGNYVDWEERFYICPECEEPIYESDWADDDLSTHLCPVCQSIVIIYEDN